MGAVTITVDSTESFKQRVKVAFAGKRQQEQISFGSFDLLWKVLAPTRMALVQTLTGAGPVTLREAARRAGRDVRAVHSAVHVLIPRCLATDPERPYHISFIEMSPALSSTLDAESKLDRDEAHIESMIGDDEVQAAVFLAQRRAAMGRSPLAFVTAGCGGARLHGTTARCTGSAPHQ